MAKCPIKNDNLAACFIFFLVFVSVCTSPTCTEYSGIRTPNEMIIFDFTSFDSFSTILLIMENALIDQFFIDYAHHSNSNKEQKMHSHSNELVITFFCSVCKCKCAKTFNHISKKKNRSKFFIFSSSNKKAKFGLREEEKKKQIRIWQRNWLLANGFYASQTKQKSL